MSKTNYQTVYGTRIYPIDYLANHELTETDLNNIFDDKKKCLYYSLIIDMFKFINLSKRNYQIIKMITEDTKWMNKIIWTKKQCQDYEKLLIQVYKNIYQYKDMQAISAAQWFIIRYGFKVEGNTFDLEK